MKKVFIVFALLATFGLKLTESVSDSDFQEKVKVFLCVSRTEKVGFKLIDFASLLNDNHFNRSNPTVIYVHGFLESSDVQSVKTVADAYLQRGGWNVVIIDWFAFSTGLYALEVLPRLKPLGNNIGRYLVDFIQAGYPYGNIHLVGHSLGGQIVGLVGRTVYQRSYRRYRIRRITGLDPAGPGFEPMLPGSFSHLSLDDGDFVDIIHTDSGNYGYKKPIGNIDFYPNGGVRYQPGCKRLPLVPDETQSGPFGFCSHWRSWEFYAASVLNPTAYTAIKCRSWKDFTSGNCNGGDTVVMGYGTPSSASGTYYLRADPPTFQSDFYF